jgi:hypothetical protein
MVHAWFSDWIGKPIKISYGVILEGEIMTLDAILLATNDSGIVARQDFSDGRSSVEFFVPFASLLVVSRADENKEEE